MKPLFLLGLALSGCPAPEPVAPEGVVRVSSSRRP